MSTNSGSSVFRPVVPFTSARRSPPFGPRVCNYVKTSAPFHCGLNTGHFAWGKRRFQGKETKVVQLTCERVVSSWCPVPWALSVGDRRLALDRVLVTTTLRISRYPWIWTLLGVQADPLLPTGGGRGLGQAPCHGGLSTGSSRMAAAASETRGRPDLGGGAPSHHEGVLSTRGDPPGPVHAQGGDITACRHRAASPEGAATASEVPFLFGHQPHFFMFQRIQHKGMASALRRLSSTPRGAPALSV